MYPSAVCFGAKSKGGKESFLMEVNVNRMVITSHTLLGGIKCRSIFKVSEVEKCPVDIFPGLNVCHGGYIHLYSKLMYHNVYVVCASLSFPAAQ